MLDFNSFDDRTFTIVKKIKRDETIGTLARRVIEKKLQEECSIWPVQINNEKANKFVSSPDC